MKAAFFGIVLALLPACAAAQSDASAEWARTVAAGKKEGEIVMLAPANASHRDFLNREWSAAFPEIKLSMQSVPGWAWFQRLQIERGAGKYLWDLGSTGSVNAFAVKDAGFTDPFQPEFILPEVKDPASWGGWSRVFYDREKRYVFAQRAQLKMPYYNAKMIAPEKVQRLRAQILLEPELKGKIAWLDPLMPGAGESFAPVLRKLLGDDGFRKLVQEQVVYIENQNELVEKMARGQFAIGMGPVISNQVERYKKAGLDLDIRPLGNTPEFAAYGNTGGANTILMKDRPHPNATRVFVNWLLTKPISAAFAKAMGEDSNRIDVPSQLDPAEAPVAGIDYWEPQREEYTDEMRASHDLIRKWRGRS